jgi:hypothetical protein
LCEPRGFIPVTPLRTGLAIRDLEEFAPAQRETAAGWSMSGKFVAKCAAEAPFNDHPLAILENVLNLSMAIRECSQDCSESVEHGLSSLDWLTPRNLNIRCIVMVKRSGCRSVMSIEGNCSLHHNLFGHLHDEVRAMRAIRPIR